MCVPHTLSTNTNYCTLTILSAQEANIVLSTAEETISFTLPPGQVYNKEYDENLHPIQSMKNKAIRISSDMELQILIYKTEFYTYYNDVYMVPNHIRQNNTYFTSSHPGFQYCDTSRTKQFYLVTSFYDDTFIQILQQDGTIYELDLPTFAQSSTDKANHLAMGTKITSDKPINVVSGILCVTNHPKVDLIQ